MRNPIRIACILPLLFLAAALGCTQGDRENEDLAPYLYPDSVRIDPNPAWLYENATFAFAWADHDGDMEDPTVILRFENEDEESEYVGIGEIHSEGNTGGTLWFDLEVLDGYQGTYFITVLDEAGRASNEIGVYLFVNPIPRTDDDDDGEIAG